MRFICHFVLSYILLAPPFWGQAVSVYQLRHKPAKQARRLMRQAWAELKLQHYQASVKLLRQTLAADPTYWNAQNNLGYAYLELAQRNDAEQAFRRAIDIDPLNAVGHLNVGICLLYANDFSAAEDFARAALRLSPGMAEAKSLLAIAQVGQGHWTSQARRLLEESSQSVASSATLLRRWPSAGTSGPNLSFVTASGSHP